MFALYCCTITRYTLLAGSYMRPMFFEVRKQEMGVGEGVVEVVVPQELRGRSEIIVFLSRQPIQGHFVFHLQ